MNKALLWINAILFYDLSNLVPKPKGKQAHLDYLNSRKPLSIRIKEYNERNS